MDQNITQVCAVRLKKEYRYLVKNPIENFKIYVLPANILKWYYCIYDLDDHRYRGGQYYGLIKMSRDYPYEAPKFYMYTPNGRFLEKSKICTSNSNYHQKDLWLYSWTMNAIFRGFLSLFLEDIPSGQQIPYNHMRTSIKERQQFAKNSINYNQKHYLNLYETFNNNDLCIVYLNNEKQKKINDQNEHDLNNQNEHDPNDQKKESIKTNLNDQEKEKIVVKPDPKNQESEKMVVKPDLKNQEKEKIVVKPDPKNQESEKMVVKPDPKNQEKEKIVVKSDPNNQEKEKIVVKPNEKMTVRIKEKPIIEQKGKIKLKLKTKITT
jgi:ubiquitin-protein ligase/uncharacterized RmlC-like cupin family protein